MSAISREAAALIRAQRWAALATLHESGAPRIDGRVHSVDPGGALLFHISQLAQHTSNLVEHPRCSLVISEADTLEGDPQRLQRVTLTGAASVIRRTDAAYLAAAEAYIARFPTRRCGSSSAIFSSSDSRPRRPATSAGLPAQPASPGTTC